MTRSGALQRTKTLANCPDSATPTPCLRRRRLPVRCTCLPLRGDRQAQTGGRQVALPPPWGRGG